MSSRPKIGFLARRHATRLGNDLARRVRDGEPSTGLLVNTIPKSGTHLLEQILSSIGLVDRGGFVASTPALTLVQRNDEWIRTRLARIGQREITYAHLFHSERTESTIDAIGLPMVFLHRDPVEVFESELFYLTEMNPWHRMYRVYRACDSFEERFELCLHGSASDRYHYPSFVERYGSYTPWFRADAHQVGFASLAATDHRRDEELERLGVYLDRRGVLHSSIGQFVVAARAGIDPERSHTYSKTASGRADSKLTPAQIEVVREELNASGCLTETPYG